MAEKAILRVEKLEKNFQVARHRRGTYGALVNLFRREYRTIRAVDGISFEVQPGELVAYLGPNGAGKSTTLKILTGLLVPSSGQVWANGFIPWSERERYVARIGAVFGTRTALWWDLPVIESLELLQHIYRIQKDRFQQNLRDFRNLLELDVFLTTPVRSLSLGQRMRADLCAALMHDPDLVFLDEPTIGLDVVAKERIRQFILHINRERGTTILLTTHDLSDVEKLCERVMLIDQGHLVYDGLLEKLRERFGGMRELMVHFAELYPDVSVPGAQLVGRDGLRATYHFARDVITASALIQQLSIKFRIQDLEVREPALEDTLRRVYEEKLLDRTMEL
jgi:ABC-2 type transport system ATP-binding protein